VPFRYLFCQREAIETLIYLVEIASAPDVSTLVKQFTEPVPAGLFHQTVEIEPTPDGRDILHRFSPETHLEFSRAELPPADLPRYAFKMATGSGKTWVMAMAMVWSHFHKKRIDNSPLSTNFLLIAPNVIVFQRLERDFASNRIFAEIPLIPPEWMAEWTQSVIIRGDTREPSAGGTLFLTNIQQLYERSSDDAPRNPIEKLLGASPKELLSTKSMLDRIQDLPDVVVINDEAHHVHDEGLAWTQTLLALNKRLSKGISAWLDFSATPKESSGHYFAWTVCDYPLAQAVEDRIVKAPVIVTKHATGRAAAEPERVTKDTIVEKYRQWIRAAVERWRVHTEVYAATDVNPILFIMAEKNDYADRIGEYLVKTKEFNLADDQVLTIHTDKEGEIRRSDLERARNVARSVDDAASPIRAIVSVLMLREGWDVRNVTVVLGLRPFTATAEILPEQVIGRGLRLMRGISPERTQTLEVLGTPKLLEVLRSQLEAEGVSVSTSSEGPPAPVTVEPVQSKSEYDICIPITKPSLSHNVRRITEIDVRNLDAIFDRPELAEERQVILRLEFATTETDLGTAPFRPETLPIAQEIIASITQKTLDQAHLASRFADVYPIVRAYLAERCLGKTVDLDDPKVRGFLQELDIKEAIARYLGYQMSRLTIETRELEFEHADFRLSETRPFTWRRNIPLLEAKRTVFNYVATYNNFERDFAAFLDAAADVKRFASLGTTEQGDSATAFRIDYLKPSGAIGFYHPDWVVLQVVPGGVVNWIVETKGRVFPGTQAKDNAMKEWCARVSEARGEAWQYVRINQAEFEILKPKTFEDAIPDDTKGTNPELL
jgi:type III restriction enzyme